VTQVEKEKLEKLHNCLSCCTQTLLLLTPVIMPFQYKYGWCMW